MKKYFLFLPCLLLVFTACKKTDKILPKDEGIWNISEKNTLQYENGELQSEYLVFDQGYFQFNEDGTGIMELETVWGSAPLTIDWTYNHENKTLSVDVPDTEEFYDFEVTESSKKSQTLLWGTEDENAGVIERTELKLKLDKQD